MTLRDPAFLGQLAAAGFSPAPSNYWPMHVIAGGESPDVIGSVPMTVTGAGATTTAANPLQGDSIALDRGVSFAMSLPASIIQRSMSFTMLLAFRADDFAATQQLWSKGSGPDLFTDYWFDFLLATSADIQGYLSNAFNVFGSGALSAATWYVMAVTYSAGGSTDLYVNDVLVGTQPTIGADSPRDAVVLEIGMLSTGFDPPRRFDGQMGHMALWQGQILTAGEIAGARAWLLSGKDLA